MKKESTTLIIIFAIILSLTILDMAISNMVAINKIEKAEKTIKVLEGDNELLQEQMEEYKKAAEELSEQIKDLKINISDVKKSMDQIVPQIAEIKKKDEEKENNLEVSSEEVQRSYTEETTTEYTEEVTEEYVEEITEEYVEPEYSEDIPWVVYEVVECEVHGGDKESKMHVAHVIRNRVCSDLFPNNYYDVCTAPYQFGMRSDVEQSTIDAVNEAMSIDDTTYGALFFHSMDWMAEWGGYSWKFTDNVGHHFYGN